MLLGKDVVIKDPAIPGGYPGVPWNTKPGKVVRILAAIE